MLQAVSLVSYDKSFPEDIKAQAREVRRTAHLNLAAAHLKLRWVVTRGGGEQPRLFLCTDMSISLLQCTTLLDESAPEWKPEWADVCETQQRFLCRQALHNPQAVFGTWPNSWDQAVACHNDPLCF
jgi:hypothetical protein